MITNNNSKYSDRQLLTGSFLSLSLNRFPDFQIIAHAVPSHKNIDSAMAYYSFHSLDTVAGPFRLFT